MAEGLFQGNHAVVVRARDLELLASFYAQLGFRLIRRTNNVIQFDNGGGGLLEVARLAPGANPIAEPTTRLDAPVCGVFLTSNLHQALTNALEAGGHKLDTLPLPTAMVTYVADPEGNVIGFRQPAPEVEPQPEDLIEAPAPHQFSLN